MFQAIYTWSSLPMDLMDEGFGNLSLWVKNNLPELNIGVGINYGEVVSGNIGSTRQMNYTVIGDSVNLAARLCSHAEKKQIVISDSTYQLLQMKNGFVKKDPINVKGKEKKIENWVLEIED